MVGAERVTGAGVVTIGHQVLLIRGALRLSEVIPTDRVNARNVLPVCTVNTGPEL